MGPAEERGAAAERRPLGGRARATLVARRDLTPTLALFRLAPEGGVPPFEAGQFVPLGRQLATGRTLWRAYSIASPPEERAELELFVRWVRVPVYGRFTSELWRLAPGDELLWRPPHGAFTLAAAPDERRLLLLGGGTGVAPLLSIVRHLAHVGTPREVVLCHGASHVVELVHRELLEELERRRRPDWHFRYVPTVSRPDAPANAGWTGRTGRVEALLRRGEDGRAPIEEVLGEPLDPRRTVAYACGWEATLVAVRAALAPLGFHVDRKPRPDGTRDLVTESYG